MAELLFAVLDYLLQGGKITFLIKSFRNEKLKEFVISFLLKMMAAHPNDERVTRVEIHHILERRTSQIPALKKKKKHGGSKEKALKDLKAFSPKKKKKSSFLVQIKFWCTPSQFNKFHEKKK